MRTEHFFTVNPDSKFYADYSDYWTNRKVVDGKIKDFFKMAGIQTHGYSCTENQLWIAPTSADEKNFAVQLCIGNCGDGLRRFKKRSEINQMWATFIEGTKIIQQPYMFMYFTGLHGPCRLFFRSDILYCSGEVEDGAQVPDGLNEIKGSEFWAVIEEMEARDAAI